MIASILQKGMRAQISHPASGHRSFCVPSPLSKMPPMSDDRTAGLWLPQPNYQSKAWGGAWACAFSARETGGSRVGEPI